MVNSLGKNLGRKERRGDGGHGRTIELKTLVRSPIQSGNRARRLPACPRRAALMERRPGSGRSTDKRKIPPAGSPSVPSTAPASDLPCAHVRLPGPGPTLNRNRALLSSPVAFALEGIVI